MKFGHFHSLRRFGSKALHIGHGVGKFIAGKALPEIAKVSGQVARLALKASPVVGMVAPELLPVLAGVGLAAKGVNTGTREAQKLIRVGTEGVHALQKGDVKTAIEKGKQVHSGIVVNRRPPRK
tara:strand:- start:561 stop:932 length:372 start_codon:yes stop_codon:yes gene_type:complete